MTESTLVETKSAWLSKINWTQAIAFLASILVIFGVDLPPETQVATVAAIQGIQSVVTWVLRTFFTKNITPSSV